METVEEALQLMAEFEAEGGLIPPDYRASMLERARYGGWDVVSIAQTIEYLRYVQQTEHINRPIPSPKFGL